MHFSPPSSSPPDPDPNSAARFSRHGRPRWRSSLGHQTLLGRLLIALGRDHEEDSDLEQAKLVRHGIDLLLPLGDKAGNWGLWHNAQKGMFQLTFRMSSGMLGRALQTAFQ